MPSESPLKGFDQITALTQDHINGSLYFRFHQEKHLADFTHSDAGWEIDAKMSPGTVVFDPKETKRVHFCLHFKSGTYIWYTPSGKYDRETCSFPAVEHTASIKDWTLAFTVDLGRSAIDNVPDIIKKQITFPGSYSLSQLLMDFLNPDLSSFDTKLSDTKLDPPLGAAEEATREQYLKDAIGIYLGSLHGSGHNILGYAITVPYPATTNRVNPSFPPTCLEFQTTTATKPGLSCFLFLEMTDHHPFPDGLITGTQNWVEDGKNGSMIISKKNFWDNFFVKKSTFINTLALNLTNRLAGVVAGQWGLDDSNVSWGLGQQPSGAQLDWTSQTALSMSYEWKYHDKGDVGLFGSESRSFDTTVDVTLDTSKGTIGVTASAYAWYKYDGTTGAGRDVTEYTTKNDAKVKWGYSFTLLDTTDGKLEMSVALNAPTCTTTRNTIGNHGNPFSTPDDELNRQAKEHLQSSLDDNKGTLLDEATKALEMQKQFVFPGGGYFFMKNPKFNDAGDVTLELQYKQGL